MNLIYHENGKIQIKILNFNEIEIDKKTIILDSTNDSKRKDIFKNVESIKIYDKNCKCKKIKNKNDKINILINIDEKTTINQYKNIIRVIDNSGLTLKTLTCYISKEIDSKQFREFIQAFAILYYEDIKQRYENIYDIACDKLDDEFRTKNICDFKEDRCVANRAGYTTNKNMGCCYSFKYSTNPLKFIEDIHICDYLKNKTCDTKCLACKLFTCKYLKEKGVKFRVKDIFIIDAFWNKKQLDTIQENFFMPKERIIKKLIKDKENNMPYIIYYIKNNSLIK